jgi:hypothetical protein
MESTTTQASASQPGSPSLVDDSGLIPAAKGFSFSTEVVNGRHILELVIQAASRVVPTA